MTKKLHLGSNIMSIYQKLHFQGCFQTAYKINTAQTSQGKRGKQLKYKKLFSWTNRATLEKGRLFIRVNSQGVGQHNATLSICSLPMWLHLLLTTTL